MKLGWDAFVNKPVKGKRNEHKNETSKSTVDEIMMMMKREWMHANDVSWYIILLLLIIMWCFTLSLDVAFSGLIIVYIYFSLSSCEAVTWLVGVLLWCSILVTLVLALKSEYNFSRVSCLLHNLGFMSYYFVNCQNCMYISGWVRGGFFCKHPTWMCVIELC